MRQSIVFHSSKATYWRSLRVSLILFAAACLFVTGCVKPRQPITEEPPAPQPAPPVEAASPEQLTKLPPPKPSEVNEAVKRVFKDAAVIDTARQPSFIAGDFNGDLSQDIAIVLKPATGRLAEMNEEFPAWMLKDPFVKNQPGGPPLRVEENDTLLAVIHGHGPDGWRDPEATQTYLLKNAVGSGMRARAGKEFVAANRGKKLPRLQGDLIGEVLKGTQGCLYYAGATYLWYDPKTFKGEPERRVVHEGPTARMGK